MPNARLMFNSELDRQHTISAPVIFSGVGLHTGVPVNLTLTPAAANAGIVFKRVDLEGFSVKATAANVARVSYATSLMRKGVLVSTTEHLLSALVAAGVDNVIAEIDNLEVPIMDGSASPFAREIARVGLRRQRAKRRYIRVLKQVEITEGAKRIGVYPSTAYRVTYYIDFAHPLIGRQTFEWALSPNAFLENIAPARTFGFSDEVDSLRKAGLVRGGSLENAVVLSRDGVLNREGLRFPDEFCRHKILDLIGDLALLGHPIVGHVVAHRAGHAMHYALVSHLLAHREAWCLVESSPTQLRSSAA
ncbi:MAG TPA: UDP-3-O-acyl-N-acetylglucosamine deacetylase [Terriglobia bacterium]|nr:UDP-3-O-acyl-N-acetylglucosamine deacetylase [Terriglobia bacterium]